MGAIIDFKDDKVLYGASAKQPSILTVPRLPFVWVKGEGDPNSPPFGRACAALYGFSYALRMSEKGGDAPAGFVLYSVGPLEGVWTLTRGDHYDKNDKSAMGWTIMIRQPDFLNEAVFGYFRDKTKAKAEKKREANEFLDALEFGNLPEGLCAQMLHIGPYDDEPASFEKMEQWLAREGYRRKSKDHREIYLSDPGRTAPQKLKTILRVQIEKA